MCDLYCSVFVHSLHVVSCLPVCLCLGVCFHSDTGERGGPGEAPDPAVSVSV